MPFKPDHALFDHVAASLARKWGLNSARHDDVYQEAYLACLTAASVDKYTQSQGSAQGYFYRCASNAVMAYVAQSSSPVHAGRRQAQKLRAFKTVEQPEGVEPATTTHPEAELACADWLQQVRAEVRKTLKECDPVGAALVRTPSTQAELAADLGLTCDTVHRAASRTQARLKRNRKLQRLFAQVTDAKVPAGAYSAVLNELEGT